MARAYGERVLYPGSRHRQQRPLLHRPRRQRAPVRAPRPHRPPRARLQPALDRHRTGQPRALSGLAGLAAARRWTSAYTAGADRGAGRAAADAAGAAAGAALHRRARGPGHRPRSKPATTPTCRCSASAIPDRCFPGRRCWRSRPAAPAVACRSAPGRDRVLPRRASRPGALLQQVGAWRISYTIRAMPACLTRSPTVSELIELLSLERLEDNLFRGQSRDIGTKYVFGGQVLGQALSAAQATMDRQPRARAFAARLFPARRRHRPRRSSTTSTAPATAAASRCAASPRSSTAR